MGVAANWDKVIHGMYGVSANSDAHVDFVPY